jgi:hypothetical protein
MEQDGAEARPNAITDSYKVSKPTVPVERRPSSISQLEVSGLNL